MTNKEEELIERLMRENEDFSKAKQAHAQLAKQVVVMRREHETGLWFERQARPKTCACENDRLEVKRGVESVLLAHRRDVVVESRQRARFEA